MEKIPTSPTVYLAHRPGAQGDNNLIGKYGIPQISEAKAPAILISYAYLRYFLPDQPRYRYRHWMLDSGAFTAFKSGEPVDLEAYIDCCLGLVQKDATLMEVIALDVIGDGPSSMANALKMRSAGLEVIPVFHLGEDWGLLKDYCAGFDKVGLSCRFGEPIKDSLRFYDQCFARAWPHRFHSFGWMTDVLFDRYPFHSLDSTTWEFRPVSFGDWKTFGRGMSVRGSKQDFSAEIEWYLEAERKLRWTWRKEMALLENGNGRI